MQGASFSFLLFFIVIACFEIMSASAWCLKTIFAGVTTIQSVDFSPDNQYILTGEQSGRVLLWKTDTLQIIQDYSFPAKVWQAVFSKNQQYIVIAGQTDQIHILTDSLNYIANISTGHSKVYDLDFRYDSNRLLTCGDDATTRIWNTTNVTNISSLVLIMQMNNTDVGYTCQYGDNNWIAVAGRSYIQSFDNFYNRVYWYNDATYQRFYGLRINPGGSTFIAVNQDGNSVLGTMNSSNTQSYPTGTSGSLYSCGYARDSTYYAVAGNTGQIYMFNSSNNLQKKMATNSTSAIRSFQFSYDSNYFLAGNLNGSVYFFYRFCTGCPLGSFMSKTVCQLCSTTLVGCALCTSSSVCKSCMYGYYYSSNVCKSCDVIQGCANCVSSTSCSVCLVGYYLNGVSCTRCLSTQLGCRQCSGPLQCLQCDRNSYLNAGLCVACTTLNKCLYCNSSSYCLQCISGYYSNSGVCTLCQSTANPYCLICQSATNCSSCVSGYRVNASNLCQKCIPECLFCNNTGHCFDCVTTMYVTSSFTCSFCVHPCLACSSATYCLACAPSFYLSAAGVCSNCPSGCLSCNTSTRCSSCDTGYYLQTSTRSCRLCNLLTPFCRQCTNTTCLSCQGEYLLENGTCTGCYMLIPDCILCNSSSICLQCITGYYLTGLSGNSSCAQCKLGCSNCNTTTSCFSCVQGYYWSAYSCSLCTSNCLTCTSSSASSCTSCIQGYYLSTATVGTCISCGTTIPRCAACLNATYCVGCNVGYFNAYSSCTLCTAPCATCLSSPTDCLTCDLGFYLYTTGGGTKACGQCSKECAECSNSTSFCSRCTQGYYLNQLTFQCLNCEITLPGCIACDNSTYCITCDTGFYYVNNTCSICASAISRCLRCSASGNRCSLCDYGYAQSATNTSCIYCATSIANCEHCSSSTVCLTCQPMYYVNGGSCSLCPVSCLTCFNATICQVCIDTYILLSNKTCHLCQNLMTGCKLCNSTLTCTTCIEGYYFSSNQCLSCRSAIFGCQYCSNSTHCTQCSVFYQLNVNSSCILCSSIYPACQICSNTTIECIQCESGYYVNSTGRCQLCGNGTSEGCLKCASNSTCTQCRSGYFLNSSNLCQKCESDFANCIYCNSTACLQCQSAFYLSLGVCTPCSRQGCEICLQTDPTKCVSCNSRYYLSSSQCLLCSLSIPNCLQCKVPSTCIKCESGSYLTSSNQCQLCATTYPGCSICSPSACIDCMANFFLNMTSYQCQNCTDFIEGCSFCISQSICLSCQNGFYMDNNTCQYCASIPGCLYCINQSQCAYCQQSYFLSANDSSCYSCEDFIHGCYSCSDNLTCISCIGEYKLMGGQCQVIEGISLKQDASIGIKSYYVNDTCLKHTLFARYFTFKKVQQDWPNVSQFTLTSSNYTQYILTVLKVEWSSDLTQIIFYTDNPIATQLSESVRNMPFIAEQKARLLQQASIDLGFNLKFKLTKEAAHQIMPDLDHITDLYLGYPYSGSQFYQSYIKNRPYYYYLFGVIVTIVLFILYTIKICCALPQTKSNGSIISHIFSIKCAALAVYPTYAQYTDYCYGFMTADLPWLNQFLGDALGNKNDISPKAFSMFYTNLSLVSTYFCVFLIMLACWFIINILINSCQPLKLKLQNYKIFLYNFFSFGAIFASCLALQGAISNKIQSLSVNSVFYIIGIVLYIGIFFQICYTWATNKNVQQEKNYQNKLVHLRKLRVFIKATMLSILYLSPLYFATAILCIQLASIAVIYVIDNSKLRALQYLLPNLALFILITISQALIGIVVVSILVLITLVIQFILIYYEVQNPSQNRQPIKQTSLNTYINKSQHSETKLTSLFHEQIRAQDSLTNLNVYLSSTQIDQKTPQIQHSINKNVNTDANTNVNENMNKGKNKNTQSQKFIQQPHNKQKSNVQIKKKPKVNQKIIFTIKQLE